MKSWYLVERSMQSWLLNWIKSDLNKRPFLVEVHAVLVIQLNEFRLKDFTLWRGPCSLGPPATEWWRWFRWTLTRDWELGARRGGGWREDEDMVPGLLFSSSDPPTFHVPPSPLRPEDQSRYYQRSLHDVDQWASCLWVWAKNTKRFFYDEENFAIYKSSFHVCDLRNKCSFHFRTSLLAEADCDNPFLDHLNPNLIKFWAFWLPHFSHMTFFTTFKNQNNKQCSWRFQKAQKQLHCNNYTAHCAAH